MKSEKSESLQQIYSTEIESLQDSNQESGDFASQFQKDFIRKTYMTLWYWFRQLQRKARRFFRLPVISYPL